MAVLKTRIGLFRKKQDFAPQTTEEFLRILEDEVDRLSGMVDSLLKLTSLEQVPRTDRIELSELLHQVTEDVSSLFSGKGMHISTEAAPGSIQGSRELLRRALKVMPFVELARELSGQVPDFLKREGAVPAAFVRTVRMRPSPCPIRDPESHRSCGSGSLSPSSGWIQPAPGILAEPAWGRPWSGPSQRSTAAA